jgi:D-alanine-D-alanine ligase
LPIAAPRPRSARKPVTVLLGDPRLPDATKRGGRFLDEDFTAIRELKQALARIPGYAFRCLDRHDRMLADLARRPAALVFNLCDNGLMNDPAREWEVAEALERLGAPYTGAAPPAMRRCYDKTLTTELAAKAGIPVPRQIVVPTSAQARPEAWDYPALIKPNEGDGSVAITRQALARDAAEARAYVDFLAVERPGRPFLVQEFLSGAEYTVATLGNGKNLRVLPPLATDFSALPPGLPHILCFEAKAVPDSPYWSGVQYGEARLAPRARRNLEDMAAELARVLELRDYSRIDFRAGADGTIKLLEANPNPAWAYDSKLAMMARLAGYDYAGLLGQIIAAAELRLGLRAPPRRSPRTVRKPRPAARARPGRRPSPRR